MGDLNLETNGTVSLQGGSSLKQTSMGIQLGNLDVYNFLDYNVNKNIYDLNTYNRRNNFLRNNLSKNFSDNTPRVKKSDIIPTSYYTSAINSSDIGENYRVDDKISKQGFLTPDDYIKFQNNFIKENLQHDSWRDNTKYENLMPTSYYGEITNTKYESYDGTIYPYSVKGESFEYGMRAKTLKHDLEDIAQKAWNFNMFINPQIRGFSPYMNEKSTLTGSIGMSTFGITDKVADRENSGTFKKLKKLDDLNAEFRNKLTFYENGFISNKTGEKVILSGITEVSFSDINKLTILTNNGLDEYSKTYREKYKTKLNGIKNYPKTFQEIFWNFSKMYGIVEENSEFKTYSVDSENKFEEAKINPEYIGDNSRVLKLVNSLVNKSKINSEVAGARVNNDKIYGISEKLNNTWRSNRLSKKQHTLRPFADGSTIDVIQNAYGSDRPNGNRVGSYSVLKSDGYIRITPTRDGSKKVEDCMFSIENLAWKGATMGLSEEQKGPKGGRIMWFPPYNLKFSENVNVAWNENNFIGRGEGIYTYINTTRTGTLDFTLLIDHPSIINKVDGISDNDLLDFFYGAKKLEARNNSESEEETTNTNTLTTTPVPTLKPTKFAYVIFFPENYSGNSEKTELELLNELTDYNNGLGFEEDEVRNVLFNGDNTIKVNKFSELVNIEKDKITDGKVFGLDSRTFKISSIDVKGYESMSERGGNGVLSVQRKKVARDIFKHYGLKSFSEEQISINSRESTAINNNSFMVRAASIIINITWNEEAVPSGESDINGETVDDMVTLSKSESDEPVREGSKTVSVNSSNGYDNEYLYFSNVINDREKYESIVKKISYFNPAFHSITPEGFNARLTFLHQCTRQGPTEAVSSGGVNSGSNNYLKFAGNLAFGRAPYCILRIGDFFNTKICIDSVSITYDNNGVQWDLNPEGAGVQPMFANVSISFRFIGGQDISGPVARLQNAVTSNYYANASVYSKHADTEKEYYVAKTNTRSNK